MKELPEFDVLREMAQNNPEQLEQLRMELCDQLIQEAPGDVRRRLRGLQFRIDMERRRAKSSMAACIAISGMMHESFDQLRQVLNEAAGNPPAAHHRASAQSNSIDKATVLPFQKA